MTDFQEFPDHVVQEEVEEKSDINPMLEYRIHQYDKVGAYYGWTWQDFERTPVEVVEYLNKMIDKKLAPYNKPSSGGKSGPLPFSYLHLSILLALAAMFGDDE